MWAHSDVFDLWRTRLSIRLERTQSLPAESGAEVDIVAVVARSGGVVVAEVLANARAVVVHEVDRSRTLLWAHNTNLGYVANLLVGGWLTLCLLGPRGSSARMTGVGSYVVGFLVLGRTASSAAVKASAASSRVVAGSIRSVRSPFGPWITMSMGFSAWRLRRCWAKR